MGKWKKKRFLKMPCHCIYHAKMQPHGKFQNNQITSEVLQRKKKLCFDKNVIEVRNRKKTVCLTDEKILILGEQDIEIKYGFLDGFVF